MKYRRPESVLVVVCTEDAKTLLLRRLQPVFWQSVTGSLKQKESPWDAAKRELFEETGIVDCGKLTDRGIRNNFDILPQSLHRYRPGVTKNTEHFFSLELVGQCEISICEKEHDEFRWVDIEQAMTMVWSWSNRKALELISVRF